MDILIVILLLVAGVLLLLAELFLLPGFGLAGISGLTCLAGSVVYAYWRLTPICPWAGHVVLAACLILMALAIYGFVKGHTLERMALDTTIDSKVELAKPGKKMEKLEAEAEKLSKKEENI